jgi:hypothetical protein
MCCALCCAVMNCAVNASLCIYVLEVLNWYELEIAELYVELFIAS